MKNIAHILGFLSTLVGVIACTPQSSVEDTGATSHRVEFKLPGSVAATRATTRATVITGNPDNVHPELTPPRNIQDVFSPESYLDPLPLGSTMRLLVWKAERNAQDGKWQRMTNRRPINRTFVVSGDEEQGFYYLRPCEVDKQGRFVKESGAPLMLDNGDWIVYASSPALPVDDNAGLKLTNGQEYMSSDWRYKETYPTYIHLGSTNDDVVQITLNPIIHQNARLILSLYSENQYIHSVDLLNAGIQVNGLQAPSYYPGGWSMNYTDTLQMGWTKKEDKLVLTNKFVSPVTILKKTKDGQRDSVTYLAFNVMADILPTDATSFPVNVLFSGAVNGVPANFSYNLNEKVFRPGYYYHYVGKLDVQDGVVVLEWQFNSWEEDIDFKYKESQYDEYYNTNN